MNNRNITTIQDKDNIFYKSGVFNYKSQGASKTYKLNELKKCSMITTDKGPFEDDLALALFFSDDLLIIPSKHSAYEPIYDILSVLLNLDQKAYINSMSSTENKEFLLWEAGENIMQLIPKDKFDDSMIDELKTIEVSQVLPILPDLLIWIQDLNWPIAQEIIQVLPRFYAKLIPHIIDIFQSDDDIWKYWTLDLVEKLPDESIQKLIPEIKRMAEFPTNEEIIEEVAKKAQEFIENYNK